jgi:hypothetical protein
MGENLAWLLDQHYPGRKVIVWAASFHLMRNAPTIRCEDSDYAGTVPLGHVAHDLLGDDYYALAFTAHSGRAGNLFGAPHDLPLPPRRAWRTCCTRPGILTPSSTCARSLRAARGSPASSRRGRSGTRTCAPTGRRCSTRSCSPTRCSRARATAPSPPASSRRGLPSREPWPRPWRSSAGSSSATGWASTPSSRRTHPRASIPRGSRRSPRARGRASSATSRRARRAFAPSPATGRPPRTRAPSRSTPRSRPT